MRHRHGLRKLNCTSSHRKAKFMALCNALIEHGAITTTLPKAKSLRKVIEPLVTLAGEDTVANKRLAFSRLRNRKSVSKLFDEIGPRYKSRPGGYTRVLKKGFRTGDAAPLAFIEFVDRKVDAPKIDKAAKVDKKDKVKAETVTETEEVVNEAATEVQEAEEKVEAQPEETKEVKEESKVDEKAEEKSDNPSSKEETSKS